MILLLLFLQGCSAADTVVVEDTKPDASVPHTYYPPLDAGDRGPSSECGRFNLPCRPFDPKTDLGRPLP